MRSPALSVIAGSLLVFGMGCQTGPQTSTDSTGVTYTKTIHDLHVWTAPGYDLAQLKGKSIALPAASTDVPPQEKVEEAQQFERLRRLLRDQMIYALQDKNIFGSVQSGENAAPHDYELRLAIVEYYPGNVALRLTIGFSAGHPSITVRGTIREVATGRDVFQFRTQREFEMRAFEVTDEQILENNVKDLVTDFSDYLNRVISGQPLKD